MTTAIAVAHQGGSVAQFSQEQIDLIKRTVAAGTSNDELALFLEVCKSSGLNPFQRQIYAVMRKSKKKVGFDWIEEEKMVIQTGIDGYRLIAARSGAHAGTTDAEYGPTNAEGYPEWARVTVKKMMPGGLVAEFAATARWAEYVQLKDEYRGKERTGRQIPSGQWGKMPFLMLGKCAEALALRKAFPAELSGVYTDEEMAQADSEKAARPASVVVEPEAKPDPIEQRRHWAAQMTAWAAGYGLTADVIEGLMVDNGLPPSMVECDAEQRKRLTILLQSEIERRAKPGADVQDADFEELPT